MLLITLLVWLLPWQTRYFVLPGTLLGTYHEYRTVSIYLTEIIALLCCVSGYRIIGSTLRTWWQEARVIKKYTYGAVLIFVCLSVGTSVDVRLSAYALYRVVLALGCALILRSLCVRWYAVFFGALWAGGVVQAALGLYQFFSQYIPASRWFGMAAQHPATLGVSVVENAMGRWLRAYGSFGWPTSLGIYLALVLVLGVMFYLHTSSKYWRLILLTTMPVVCAGLVVTFARGAWIAAIMGISAAIGVWWYSRSTAVRWQDTQQGLLLITSCFLVVAVYGYVVRFQLMSRVTAQTVLEQRSLSERSSQYREALLLWREQPWLGQGPGTYTTALARHSSERPGYTPQPVHSIVFLCLVEYGVVCMVMILTIAVCEYRSMKKMLPILTVLVVAGMFDHWLLTMWTGMLSMVISSVCGSFFEEKNNRTKAVSDARSLSAP